MDPPLPPPGATDVFSISDQTLAQKLHFVNEIGFGNWGSVWLCRPRSGHDKLSDAKVAVKLVHRNKSKTASARVGSLWNEMKIVRSFNDDPHPSIVPFYSFIITPSYALITMAYLPRLIPVELPESRAKPWMQSLLSGIVYLHKRGVVHNDIKPANILLSETNVPTLVDFGFAEQYNPKSSEAFISSVSYGTPEYLSPERARGLKHDTRKSDVWSLGITFFELLVGRTPFEYEEGEQFSTKTELEAYWGRTIRGKWVGQWNISSGVESMLRRMLAPNADLRCTAVGAFQDPYWSQELQDVSQRTTNKVAHKKSESISRVMGLSGKGAGSPSVVDIISPWSTRGRGARTKPRERKENYMLSGPVRERESPSKLNDMLPGSRDVDGALPATAKPVSQPERSRASAEHGGGLALGATQSKVLAVKEQAKRKYAESNEDDAALLAVLRPALKPKPSLRPKRSGIPVLSATRSNAALHDGYKNQLKPMTSTQELGGHVRREAVSVFKKLPPVIPTPIKEERSILTQSSTQKENAVLLTTKSRDVLRRPLGPRIATSPSSAADSSVDILASRSDQRSMRNKENMSANSSPKTADRKKAGRTSRRHGVADPTTKGKKIAVSSKVMEDEDGDAPAELPSSSFSHSRSNPNVSVSDSVRSRIAEWANARERLREMSIELEVESEIEFGREHSEEDATTEIVAPEQDASKPSTPSTVNTGLGSLRQEKETQRCLQAFLLSGQEKLAKGDLPQDVNSGDSSFIHMDDTTGVLPRPNVDTSLNMFKQSFKASIGQLAEKTARSYKSSLNQISHVAKRPNPRLSVGTSDDEDWGDAVIRHATSRAALGALAGAPVDAESDAATVEDRMTAWMQNIERVVQDASQNFVLSSTHAAPVLPVAPPSRQLSLSRSQTRSNRSSRLPRKPLAANQIFVDGYEDGSFNTSYFPSTASPRSSDLATPEPSTILEESSVHFASPNTTATPPRPRRYTIVTRSPKPSEVSRSTEIDLESPSKRKDRWRSQGDLLQKHIAPKEWLNLELERVSTSPAKPSLPLSAVVDRKLFVAEPRTPGAQDTFTPDSSMLKEMNSLTASPLHVDPYPPRPATERPPIPDTPARRQLETVYDRFLMATSGVKRVGAGYQSNNTAPTGHNHLTVPIPPKRHGKRFNVNSSRRPMPPPVSSDDYLKAVSVDELGIMSPPGVDARAEDEEGRNSFAVVRRALKAAVNGKTISRRLSRID